MKAARQAMILKLIKTNNIETQDDLVLMLNENGISVTQATASRDIRELHLLKTMHGDGEYRYSSNENDTDDYSRRLAEIFANSVLSIKSAGNMIIVKTISGSANSAAEAIDALNLSGIAGSIAGDNTIFIVVNDDVDKNDIIKRLESY